MRRAFLAAAVLVLLQIAAAMQVRAQCKGCGPPDGETRYSGYDTLWIFDADFEDLTGDNAGWLSLDMSGTPGRPDYWHKDTIRINGFTHLGDSTWWCGTYNSCWYQPRGYGNDWDCSLAREFPLSEWSEPGDAVTLEWDQRFAMEHDYDYGYVDVSTDGGSTWTTVRSFTNPGFAGKPGASQDWDSPAFGHPVLDLSGLAGQDALLRYRFESDAAYSSQDQYDNGPPWHSVLDGAWQLDNIVWKVNGEVVWLDDCEAPGDNVWAHEDEPPVGQTGVVFRRVFQPDHLRGFRWAPLRGYWMAAVDSLTGRMVDGENAWLVSPPIGIAGAERLVAEWDVWADCWDTHDYFAVRGYANDNPDCWQSLGGFTGWDWRRSPDSHFTELEDWSPLCGPDWLHVIWALKNTEPSTTHWAGLMLNRHRIGVPVGGPPTEWAVDTWTTFHDTFDLDEALGETMRVMIEDADGIASALLVASNDGGVTWESYAMTQEPGTDWWTATAPSDLLAPGTEIRFYFEATDGTGTVSTFPWAAPDVTREFSVLPILGSVSDPCILLVDKHGRLTPCSDGQHAHRSEYYFREVLDVLGHSYDVYDVEVPSGSTDQSDGPDSSGMKYYDTQVWFTGDFNAYTIKRVDQRHLIHWLSQAQVGKERNLLLTGNGIGYELMEAGLETLHFYTQWLGSDYVAALSLVSPLSIPGVRDAAGGFDFMTYDDGQCCIGGYT